VILFPYLVPIIPNFLFKLSHPNGAMRPNITTEQNITRTHLYETTCYDARRTNVSSRANTTMSSLVLATYNRQGAEIRFPCIPATSDQDEQRSRDKITVRSTERRGTGKGKASKGRTSGENVLGAFNLTKVENKTVKISKKVNKCI